MDINNANKTDIHSILNKIGYKDIVPTSYYDKINLWLDWYEGDTKFHHYNQYNGVKQVACKRKTLNMAKKICEDKADLLLNEKVNIITKQQDFLDSVLDDNNFWAQGNNLVEIANALGTGAFVEYLDGGDVAIDYVTADCIYPLTWRNGIITECAFASVSNKGTDGEQTYLNLHVKEGGQYVVKNSLYNKDGVEIDLPDDVVPVYYTNSDRPLYQIVKPNIVNNVMIKSPMGVSVYASSIDNLEGIDLIFDSYMNEFNLGKKRIYVKNEALKMKMDDGIYTPLFDTNDVIFYALPEDTNGEMIKESDMTLRVDEHQTGLQSALDLLSEKVGFGKGYYKFDVDNVQTATAVISQNSKLYRKIKKDEIVLNKALRDMVKAILFLGGYNADDEISICFDDSIIEDKDAISKRALMEYQSGLIDEVEYYKKVYGLEQEAAEKLAQDIASRKQPVDNIDFYEGADE